MAATRSLPADPSRAVRAAKAVAAVVAFIASVLGILFLLWPSLKPEPPSRTRKVDLSRLKLERPVTFGAYLRRIHQPPGDLTDATLNQRGALASFDFVIVGYKDRRLPIAWQLIDTRAGDVLAENRDVWLEPEANNDSGNWPVWVPLPKGEHRRAFIEVKLYEPRGVVALRTLRTRAFAVY
jgi:hypothetical protein